MKISYNWLKNYIDTDLSIDEMSTLLTDIGLEIEGIEKYEEIEGSLAGVVVGHVIECNKVEGSDHLNLTQVNVGNEILQIVCGASNIAKNLKVLVATPGTTLHPIDGESFTIKRAKLRGIESCGMICSEKELGIGNSHAGIKILDANEPAGRAAADIFKIEKDYVFEIGLTPNRSDAMCHIGVAKDLYAAIKYRMPNRKATFKMPDVSKFTTDNTDLPISIDVKNTDACIRYSGLTFSNVKVSESPKWLKNYLKAVGLRPVNAIVDVTQFVMLECGLPLHAFDFDKITGKKVIIENLEEGREFTTLDGVVRKLSKNDLMICNENEGMCIAGVFGGEKSGISNNTQRVFLESACFNPVSIRKTAKRHDLHTDASFRYERGTNVEITTFAAKRAATLLKEITGCEITSNIYDVYPKIVEKAKIEISLNRINQLLGYNISFQTIEDILLLLDFEIIEKKTDSAWIVAAPMNKVDVTREADVAEEILRIYGYNEIPMPEKANTVFTLQTESNIYDFREHISDILSHKGLNEIMCNSLCSYDWHEKTEAFNVNEFIKVENPLSRELNILRPSLLSGMLQSFAYNINRKNDNLQMFEMGRTYKKISDDKTLPVTKQFEENEMLGIAICGNIKRENWKYKEEKSDFFEMKSLLNQVFSRSGIEKRITFNDKHSSIFTYGASWTINDKLLAEFGLIDPKICKMSDIDIPVWYAQINMDLFFKISRQYKCLFIDIPKFPEVRRDLSLLLNKKITFEQIKNTAFSAERKLLKEVNLFDVYIDKKLGDDKKSYAVSFILRNESKTLTDKETDASMARITKAIVETFNADVR